MSSGLIFTILMYTAFSFSYQERFTQRRLPHWTMGKTWAMLINYLLKVPQPLKLNRKLSSCVQRMKQSTNARMWLTSMCIDACIQSIKTNINGNHNRPESGCVFIRKGTAHSIYILCTLGIKITYRIIHKKYVRMYDYIIHQSSHNLCDVPLLLLILMMIMVPRTKLKHGPVGSHCAYNQWSLTQLKYFTTTNVYTQTPTKPTS